MALASLFWKWKLHLCQKYRIDMNKTAKKVIELIPWILTSIFLLAIPYIWADETMMDASLLPRQLLLAAYLLVMLPFFAVYIFKGYRLSFDRTEKVIFCGLALFMLMHIVSCINVINGHEAFFHMAKEFLFCLWFFTIFFQHK